MQSYHRKLQFTALYTPLVQNLKAVFALKDSLFIGELSGRGTSRQGLVVVSSSDDEHQYAKVHVHCFSHRQYLLLPVVSLALFPTLLLLLIQPLLLRRLLRRHRLGTIVLAHGLHDRLLFLWLDNVDRIRQGLLRPRLAFGVGSAHDLDLDAQHALAEKDVAGSRVDEVLGRLTRVDHESILN